MPPPSLTEEPEDEEWLATYADAITLLMAFFVMLLNFSKIDLPMFDAAMAGIKNEIGMGKDTSVPVSQEVQAAVETAAFEMNMEQVVEVYKDEKGVVINMASKSFFKPGTAIITDDGVQLIMSWAGLLTSDKFKYFYVEVAGHTDDDPIHTKQFPSNWELSGGRASAVVRLLESQSLLPFQLKSVGLGASHPKVPNRDPQGNPIKANQEKNRRIVIHLIQMLPAEKSELDDILLEIRLAEEERRRAAEDEARRKAVQEAVGQVAPAGAPAATPAQP